jgi:hypothetical protein
MLRPMQMTHAKKFGPQETDSARVVNTLPVIGRGLTPTTSFEDIRLVLAAANLYGERSVALHHHRGCVERAHVGDHDWSGHRDHLNFKQWDFRSLWWSACVIIESITIGDGIPTNVRDLEVLSRLEVAGTKVLKPRSPTQNSKLLRRCRP